MALSFTFTGAFAITYNAVRGLLAGAGTAARTIGLKLTDGTAAGQADGIFTADTAVSSAGYDAYLLAAGLADLFGQELEFSAIKFLMIEADPANVAPLEVGGGSFGGPLGDPTATVLVQPADTLVWMTQSANGWAVDPLGDALPISGTPGDLYKLTVVGVSSAVSAPAWATHPAIIGTPQIGTLLYCTAGDVSGSPALGYQWRRNGAVIPNATAATYTPVAADAGKKLSRTTFATNSAGTTPVTTKDVLVPAAAVVVNTDGVMDANLNPALFGH